MKRCCIRLISVYENHDPVSLTFPTVGLLITYYENRRFGNSVASFSVTALESHRGSPLYASVFSYRYVLFMSINISSNRPVKAPPVDPKSRDEYEDKFTSGLYDCDTRLLNLQMIRATRVFFWNNATETVCLHSCDTDRGMTFRWML
jgi:hypothetical protein